MPRSVSETLNMLNIATAEFLEDAVTQINADNVVSARLLSKSKAATGKLIGVPLIVAEENVTTMGKYDPYNLQPQEILDEAQYTWKRINGTLTLDDMTVDVQNIDDSQLIDLAKTKVQNLTESMKKKFSTLLFTATGSLGANDPDSLDKIVGTQNNTVGGIDAATGVGGNGTVVLDYSWNPSLTDDSAQVITWDDLTDPTSDYSAERILQKKFASLTYGSDHPTLILCTQGFFDAYEYLLASSKRYDGKQMDVSGGFTGLNFRNVPLVVDNNVPGGKLNTVTTNTGQVLFLNEKYLGYRHSPRMNFKWKKWMKLEQQPVYASLLDWAGSFICSNRQRQGSYIGIPTDSDLGLT